MNAADRYGRTALHIAAIRGDKKIETAQRLVKTGASIDAMDPRGATALHYAAANNARKIVTLMLSHREPKPNVNAVDIDGQTPLHLAAAQNLLDVVKLLVGLDDSLPKGCPKVDHTIRDHRGRTALDYALKRQANAEQRGEKAIVQLLKLLPPPRRALLNTCTASLDDPTNVPNLAAAPAEKPVDEADAHHRSSAAVEPTERGRAAEARHFDRLASAKLDRLECPVGKPITARWSVPSNTVDPWLKQWLQRKEALSESKQNNGKRRNCTANIDHAVGKMPPRPWVTLSGPCADDHSSR